PAVFLEQLCPTRALARHQPEVPVVPVVPANRDVRRAVRLKARDAHHPALREKRLAFGVGHPAELAPPSAFRHWSHASSFARRKWSGPARDADYRSRNGTYV